ncbi:MAG: HNH endonuclease family protein [Candidatus Moranbacteria bacterium GW2011_GWD2_36_12]|nr:MAG: HNH endonuclease family protein [Candidatus Moranbacteria bacterium GW2011_GWD2_36_12]
MQKIIKNFKKRYSIDEDGYVIDLVTDKNIKHQYAVSGYNRVRLWKDGKRKEYLVHRLVALTFLRKKKNRTIVNHKDCDKKNNNVNNLEFCTYSENAIHAYNYYFVLKLEENNKINKNT